MGADKPAHIHIKCPDGEIGHKLKGRILTAANRSKGPGERPNDAMLAALLRWADDVLGDAKPPDNRD